MQTHELARIPCLIVTHGRDDINQESLMSIRACDPRLEIDVVHNPSVQENGSFIAFARAAVLAGEIRSFTRFDKNISNNAVLLFLLDNLDRYSADRVVISDGDVVPPRSLIVEQTAVLDAHPDVLACGLRVDATAWPDSLHVKDDLVERYNTSRFETEDYLDTATGMWMTMFRGPEFVALVNTIRDNGLRLTDANVKQLGAALFQKKWVATKYSVGRELTRERPDYHDNKAVSTRHFGDHSPEPAGSNYATWNHDCVVPAVEWAGKRERPVTFPPLPRAQPRFRGPIARDPVVAKLSSGELQHSRGYLANHLLAATNAGLAFVTVRDKPSTGLPFLGAERSAIYVATAPEPGDQLANLSEVDAGPVLLAFQAAECQSILFTVERFIGIGGLLHGIVFSADEVRRHFSEGGALPTGLLPKELRNSAAKLAGRGATGRLADREIEEFVARLWTEEALASWLPDRAGSVQLSKSIKNPHLTYFRMKL